MYILSGHFTKYSRANKCNAIQQPNNKSYLYDAYNVQYLLTLTVFIQFNGSVCVFCGDAVLDCVMVKCVHLDYVNESGQIYFTYSL